MAAAVEGRPGPAQIRPLEQQIGIHPHLQARQPLGTAGASLLVLPDLQPFAHRVEHRDLILQGHAEGLDRRPAQIARSAAPGHGDAPPAIPGAGHLLEQQRGQAAGLEAGLEGPPPQAAELGVDRAARQRAHRAAQRVLAAAVAQIGRERAAAQAEQAGFLQLHPAVEGQRLQLQLAVAAEQPLQGLGRPLARQQQLQAMQGQAARLPAVLARIAAERQPAAVTLQP